MPPGEENDFKWGEEALNDRDTKDTKLSRAQRAITTYL